MLPFTPHGKPGSANNLKGFFWLASRAHDSGMFHIGRDDDLLHRREAALRSLTAPHGPS